MSKERQTSVVVMASSFPRWADDSTTRFVLDFARQMQTRGYKITATVPHFEGAKTREILDGVATRRFRYWFTPAGETLAYGGGALGKIQKTPVYALKLVWLLAALWWSAVWAANRERAKIINAHWLVPQGFIAILARPFTDAKVIITIHGGDVFGLNGKLFRKIKVWTLKRADAVVVNSSATQEVARSLFPGRDYPIIPMGIDTDLFAPSATSSKNKKLEILFAGRVVEEKGPIYLCQAINQLVKAGNKNVHLTIAGTGPELAKLKSYTTRHKLASYIRFTGWISHEKLAGLYASCDVTVAPSIISKKGWQEAFGLIFAESLACGTPVIGTKTGGIKDIVKDGQTGFLVEQKDAAALAAAIQKFLADPTLAPKMGKRGRKFIVDNYSWEKIGERYQRVFEDVLTSR